MTTLTVAIALYKRKFKDTPTVIHLPREVQGKAVEALIAAVRKGRPYKTDKEWWEALGMEAPPKGALV